MLKLQQKIFATLLLAATLLPFSASADQFDGRPGFPGRPGRPGHPGRPDFGGCRPGETVWTASGLEGVVEAVFPDGRVSVKINYSNYMYDRSQLASRGCSYGVCSGQNVITSSGLRGVVNGTFMDGRVSVKINYSNYVYNVQDLASDNPYNPAPGLRIGATVWTRSGLEGKVAGVFPNGDVSVTINYSNYKYGQYDLAQVGCIYNLCSGNSVITQSGLRGVVNGVFADSRVSVKINYSNYQYDYSQLARTR